MLNADELVDHPSYHQLVAQVEQLQSSLGDRQSEADEADITLDLAYALRDATEIESKFDSLRQNWNQIQSELRLLRSSFGINSTFSATEAARTLKYPDRQSIQNRLNELHSLGYLDTDDPDVILVNKTTDELSGHDFSEVIETLKQDVKHDEVRLFIADHCDCPTNKVKVTIDSLSTLKQIELVEEIWDEFPARIGKGEYVETVGVFRHLEIYLPEPDNWYLTEEAAEIA